MTATDNIDYSSRTITAHGRRNDSVRRWLESDTAKAPDIRADGDFKIRFEDGAMLLSAVAAGDIDETKRLLDLGADVNYANIDGLTSLHQACIDENIEMVELLVSRGAMLNACDNEGWTPLHAAASTTALDVITYLVENGGDIASVNTEGEVPLDLAEDPDVQIFFSNEVRKRNIDLDEARSSEHRYLLSDALKWKSNGVIADVLDSQGATALHVASSKGYIDVVKILLDIGADVNCQDYDGWTPLHAAVYWKQQAVCELLLQSGAKIHSRNNLGQSPIDLAEDEMVPFVRSLARTYKSIEGFGGSDKINRPSPTIKNSSLNKTPKNLVGIIKIPKQPTEDIKPKENDSPQVERKNETVTQAANPPRAAISRPPKPSGPLAVTTSKISSTLPSTEKAEPTVVKTQTVSNEQQKQPDKVITKVALPPSSTITSLTTTTNSAKKESTVISKPPVASIPKPSTIIHPPKVDTNTSTQNSQQPVNDVAASKPKPGIVRPPTSSNQKITTPSKIDQKGLEDRPNQEKDYSASIQQLAALKVELAEIIKERDMLKSKFEKAESDLLNYNKLLEENTRLSKENSSLVKVIATFNRSTPNVDKNSSGTSS